MANKHIGIVACSAEGAALCYRTICAEARVLLGEHMHPEITMHTYPLAQYMGGRRDRDWSEVAKLMVASANKVAGAGADFAICPDNTIHEAFEEVSTRSPIPWLNIAEVVGETAKKEGMQRLGILGTKFLMTGAVYPEVLKSIGIAWEIPTSDQREAINQIIFDELVYGVIEDESRATFSMIIDELQERGCDGIVLGCTEIPLLIRPEDSPLPTLDSTRILARAALRESIGSLDKNTT